MVDRIIFNLAVNTVKIGNTKVFKGNGWFFVPASRIWPVKSPTCLPAPCFNGKTNRGRKQTPETDDDVPPPIPKFKNLALPVQG